MKSGAEEARRAVLDKRDRRALAPRAASRAEQVLPYFKTERPEDDQPRKAIDAARAWARGEMTVSEARAAARAAHGNAARAAARAAGHAAATVHVAAHAPHAASYASAAEAAGGTQRPPAAKPPGLSRVRKMIPEPLDFHSAAEWRSWLAKNHAKSQGEWIYMYKKGAVRTGLRYQQALEEALCFGWIDGQIHAVDQEKFRQRWTPRRPGSVWSQVNKTKVKRLLAEGRMTEAGLGAIREAKKTGRWQAAYTNLREDRVPSDLVRSLRADPEAWRNFRGLARTYRNMYSGWVLEAKQEGTRKRRIEAVVRRARENRKPGMDSMYS